MLLDVNVLLALCFAGHPFHSRVAKWVAPLIISRSADFLTCAITELAVIRIAPAARYCQDVRSAQAALAALKRAPQIHFALLPDDLGADIMPRWLRKAEDTTDGHLLELAVRAGAQLATLDRRIPGAVQIP